MNLFTRKPNTDRQRDRWFALIDVVSNERCTSMDELRAALARRGHSVSEPTMLSDVRACRVFKVDGVYTIMPVTTNDVLETILKARLRVAVEQIFRQGDIVVINCNQGGAAWIVSALKEYDNDNIVSYVEGRDNVWLMAPEGRGERLYEAVALLFRKART